MTRELVDQRTPVIYQPRLSMATTLDGVECRIVGDPDFLVYDSGTYNIRDSKLSRRITEQDHPEILRQMELYGWLYEQTFGTPPGQLEVHSGSGDIVD